MTLEIKDIAKYYSVFAYDDVPNYSEPLFVGHLKKEDDVAQV